MRKTAVRFTFLLVCFCFCSLNDAVSAKSLDTILDIQECAADPWSIGRLAEYP